MAKYLPLLIKKWCLGDYIHLCGLQSNVLKFILAASSHLICLFKPGHLKKRVVSVSPEGWKLLLFQDTEQRRGVFWRRRHCHTTRSASLLHRGKLSLCQQDTFFLHIKDSCGVQPRSGFVPGIREPQWLYIITLEQLQLFDKVDTWAEVTATSFITSWIGKKNVYFVESLARAETQTFSQGALLISWSEIPNWDQLPQDPTGQAGAEPHSPGWEEHLWVTK